METALNKSIEQLLEADRAWAEAERGDDVDRICSYWSEDAVLYNVMGTDMRVTGLDAIRAFVIKARSMPGRSLSWTPTEAFVSASGDAGATRGTYEVTSPGADGQPATRYGTYFNVWKKTEDGEWKCAFETHAA